MLLWFALDLNNFVTFFLILPILTRYLACPFYGCYTKIDIVSGRQKAAILKEAFFGPVTPQVPASVLQLHHDVTLIADIDALSAL